MYKIELYHKYVYVLWS